MLVQCASCGAAVSVHAERCPACKGPATAAQRASEYGPCRSCGTELHKPSHVYSTTSSSIVDGNTSTSTHWRSLPCPKCGDKEPISIFSEGVRQNKMSCIMAIGVVILGTAIMYFVF